MTDQDREVAMVAGHPLWNGDTTDAGDHGQCLAITLGDHTTPFKNLIQVFHLQQAERRLKFVHLAVDAGCYHGNLIGKAKILQVVYPLLELAVMANQGATLEGIEYLCGMKADHRYIAVFQQTFSLPSDGETMGGVVHHLEAICLGNGTDTSGVARIAIAMHRHDRSGLRSYRSLDLAWVQVAGLGVDVDEYRAYAVPQQGMGGGNKSIGGGDHLAGNAQCLQAGQ